jgi:hypothetical protein
MVARNEGLNKEVKAKRYNISCPTHGNTFFSKCVRRSTRYASQDLAI